ncbi:class II aldolase/adducin family protein [Pseudactinotalea terrae]|uniref:class II aldolase/adducin family protein n=1 Tax=Pseudactinotalea terrae TaxID=1743262 RepID=UPI0012E11E33|nr:class II aldolase/adducin family protein [Pseudactinotalea terrae]
MLDDLCSAARALTDWGLSPGASGNISVREGDRVYVSPSGVALGDLTPDQVAVLEMGEHPLDFTHVAGPTPSKEVPLHLAFYRSGFSSVVHLHSSAAVAVSCLPPWSPHSALPPITPYLLMRVGRVPLIAYARPGDVRLAERVLEQEQPLNAVLLQNHGSVAAGDSVEQAMSRVVEIEEAAKVVLALGGHDGVRHLSADDIAELQRTYQQPWLD